MKRPSTWLRWRVARGAMAGVVGLWLLSLSLVLVWQQRDSRAPSRAIVVLGAAQYDGKPSPVLRARVDHAIGLWQQGLAPTVIMTGGRAPGDTTTEAAVARRYAIANGVPDSVVLLESESRTTSEALRNVAAMLRPGATDVILVSDPFHMLRLSILAKRFGLQPHTSPTHTSPISNNRAEFWLYALRESVKAPVALLFDSDRR
ncbi:MAG TPA: YdcF family protein [Gemmatimonadaceae bacterium]